MLVYDQNTINANPTSTLQDPQHSNIYCVETLSSSKVWNTTVCLIVNYQKGLDDLIQSVLEEGKRNSLSRK